MAERLHNCIYLSAEDFLLLAAGAGLEQVESMFRKPIDAEAAVEENIRRSLFSLCDRGLLYVSYENEIGYFQVCPELRESFAAIRDAAYTALVFSCDDPSPRILLYVAERAAVLQVSETDENAVRIFSMEPDDLQNWLREEEYLPLHCNVRDAQIMSDEEQEWSSAQWLRQGSAGDFMLRSLFEIHRVAVEKSAVWEMEDLGSILNNEADPIVEKKQRGEETILVWGTQDGEDRLKISRLET